MLGIPRLLPGKGLARVMFVGGVTMLATATGAALAVAGFYRAAAALGTPAPPALWLSLLLAVPAFVAVRHYLVYGRGRWRR